MRLSERKASEWGRELTNEVVSELLTPVPPLRSHSLSYMPLPSIDEPAGWRGGRVKEKGKETTYRKEKGKGIF